MNNRSLLELKTENPPPLDKNFCPIFLGRRNYQKAVEDSNNSCSISIALERKDGAVARKDLDVFQEGTKYDIDTIRFIDREIKSLLWVNGGSKLYISGSSYICEKMKNSYSCEGERSYDINRMEVVYGKKFNVAVVDIEKVPEEKKKSIKLGGFLDGCRIGFDLGASDYKLSAVIDGEVVFTTEIPWNPSVEKNPMYHYNHISSGLRLAAEKLPKVDAIGGSAAGAYVNNEVKYASLFRSIPEREFAEKIKPIFLNMKKDWGVPFEVLNDGEVTALAGGLSLKKSSLLGIAMGSSEATGFINSNSHFTGSYNELAYVPIDFNRESAVEVIANDYGCGAQYFSQQAVNRLALEAGIVFPEAMLLPERLKIVQEMVENGDQKAIDIFSTIGIYLGYTLPYYQELYNFENLLILGRVTSGRGGEIIIDKAKTILTEIFPELGKKIYINVPDEKSRRVGQAVAAASLPKLRD